MNSRQIFRPVWLAVIATALLGAGCEKLSGVAGKVKEKISSQKETLKPVKPIAAGEDGYLLGGMLHTPKDEAYPVLIRDPDRLVVAYFFSERSPACKMLTPEIGALAAEFPMTTLFLKVDVDAQPKLAETNKTAEVPSLRLFRSGKLLGQINESGTIDDIRIAIKAHAPQPVAVKATPKVEPAAAVPVKKKAPVAAPPAEPSFLEQLKQKAGLAEKTPKDPSKFDKDGKPIVPPIRPVEEGEEWLPAGMGQGKPPPAEEKKK